MCPSLGDTNLSIASIYNASYPGECLFYFKVRFSISMSRSILFSKHWPASLSGRGATPKHEQWTLTITMCYQTSFQKFLLWRKSHNINTAPLRPGADNTMQYTGDGFFKCFWLVGVKLNRPLIGSQWDRNYVWLFSHRKLLFWEIGCCIVATMINCVLSKTDKYCHCVTGIWPQQLKHSSILKTPRCQSSYDGQSLFSSSRM